MSTDKTLSSFDLISHPDRTLESHVGSCADISKIIFSWKKFNETTFFERELLDKVRHLLVWFHDFGKGTDYFQVHILRAIEGNRHKIKVANFEKKYEEYITFFNSTRRIAAEDDLYNNPSLTQHAKLGAYFVLTQFTDKDIILPFIISKIIRRHHGYLTNFVNSIDSKPQFLLSEGEKLLLDKQVAKMNFEAYQQMLLSRNLTVNAEDWPLAQSVVKTNFYKLKGLLEKNRDMRYFFFQHFLFSILLSADKGDMMLPHGFPKDNYLKANQKLPLSIVGDFVTEFKKKILKGEEKDIDKVRDAAYKDIEVSVKKFGSSHNFFSITLPTGLGKTFAAYNAAVILQNLVADETNVVPRIIYCLPFTSVIDQNAEILRGILDLDEDAVASRMSKNHYLSPPPEEYDNEKLENDEGEYLADGWEFDIIITTFVQFLEGIFTNKNRALRKFHNMTNAVIVLDEVQSIPPQYFAAVELVFQKMAEYFNTKFIFVTATQPFLFKEEKDVLELTDPTKVKTRQYFEKQSRITLDQSLLKTSNYTKMDFDEIIDIVAQDISNEIDNQSNKSFLIICNTIGQSQKMWCELKTRFPTEGILYLSSSILPFKRKEIIEKIKTTKGKQIVVSTQVVEAGVDIDLDVVYRDFAPIDSINQSAGRCNRNGLKGSGGVVKLYQSGKHSSIYDTTLINITQEVLKKQEETLIPESKLYDLNIEFATLVRNRKADKSSISPKLINWMETLALEDIDQNFQLIPEDYRHYNVFIPCAEAIAEGIWAEYIERCKIVDDFERKREIKAIKPKLLQYVTRFPKAHYVPKNPEKFLHYAKDWETYYSLETGFRLDQNSSVFI